MPLYAYDCLACGDFSAFAPLARYDQPAPCPDCGEASPRAGLSVPMLAGMDASRFKAHAVNEKSAHAPETSTRTGRHPSGCGCCKPAARTTAAKSFPGTRPWMIGH
jgi:putative FmdB family regulatory protein